MPSIEACDVVAHPGRPRRNHGEDNQSRRGVEEVPVVAECGRCGSRSEISAPPFACRECGAVDLDIVTGRELIVVSIEAEEQQPEE